MPSAVVMQITNVHGPPVEKSNRTQKHWQNLNLTDQFLKRYTSDSYDPFPNALFTGVFCCSSHTSYLLHFNISNLNKRSMNLDLHPNNQNCMRSVKTSSSMGLLSQHILYGIQVVRQLFYLDDRYFKLKYFDAYIFYYDSYIYIERLSVNKLSTYLSTLQIRHISE